MPSYFPAVSPVQPCLALHDRVLSGNVSRVMDLKNKLYACYQTLGYFTPVHERGTKWNCIEGHIPTISRQAPLMGFMNLVQAQSAQLLKSENRSQDWRQGSEPDDLTWLPQFPTHRLKYISGRARSDHKLICATMLPSDTKTKKPR